MSDKEISTLIKSIVDSCRTFYVGTASAIDDEGYVTLNGIRAAVVGVAEQADVILKDATSGAWVAFIRGTGEVVSTNTIKLYLSLPTDEGEISLYFFVSAESLQNVLIVRGVRQIVGVFGFTVDKPYYTQLAPWLVSIPGTFSFEGDYLNYATPKGDLHLKAGDASFGAVDSLLRMNVSSQSLPGSAAINIKKIEKTPTGQDLFFQFYIQPSIAPSGIRRTIEKWSLGISKGKFNGEGDYGSASLKKSLCIGFKNEIAPTYSKFYAWYRHRLQFVSSWRDFLDVTPPSACSLIESSQEVITEYPLLEVFSNARAPNSLLYSNFNPSLSGYSIPPASYSRPLYNFITAFYHYGNGDFKTGENVFSSVFSGDDGDFQFPVNISYEVNTEEVLAKRMKLFITIEGVNYYARHVRYGSGDDYRLGFFREAQSPVNTDLTYYGDTTPFLADLGSTDPFLLPQTLTFSTAENAFFGGDDFLWSNVFRDGVFPSTGFVDPNFPEGVGSESCTFIKATASEGYTLSVPIGVEFLSPDQWAYKESLTFLNNGTTLLQAIESPLPRSTPSSKIRVAFQSGGGGWIAGQYGVAKDSLIYFDQGRLEICISLNFQRWYSSSPNRTAPLNPEDETTWTFDYFPGKRTVSILHEYTGNVARKARLYIDRDGTRYYGYLFPTYLRFFEETVATPTIFHVELGSEIPRRFIGGAGNNSETEVSNPFDGRTLRFDSIGTGDKELEWLGGNVFERNGFASPVIGGGFSFYNRDTFPATRLPVTIQIEFAPEEEWAKTERITLDGTVVRDSHLVVKGGSPQTNAYLRVVSDGSHTDMFEMQENYFELRDLDSLPGFVAPCSTSTVFLNKKLNSEDQVFHGFLHLKPGESEIVDLSPTGFSFANSPLTIYAEGKVSFQDLVLIPFVAPLDTSFFTAYFNPFRSGYINYAEGYADNITGGINEIPCLRIEWRRAYRYVPGATEYDSDFNAERFLDFEILFVDLEDRIDVVFRYLYLGGGMTQDLPLAGIAEGVCVFPGSKEADGLDDLLTRKISTSNPGEVRFYIKDGKIHGYDEITLFEDGSAELPIRRCIPPMEDLFREVCGMLRIETIKEPGNPEQKKITLYASSSITGGTLNLTKAIPPTFSAETGTTDFFGQPPLENVNGII